MGNVSMSEKIKLICEHVLEPIFTNDLSLKALDPKKMYLLSP